MRLTSPTTLSALMKQRDMSMGTLARYSGCSKGFISHLIAGRRSTCTPQLAEHIAEALQVPLELLFLPSVDTSGTQTGKQQTRKKVAA